MIQTENAQYAYAGWESMAGLIHHEVTQSKEEGKDPVTVDRLGARMENIAASNRRAIEALHAEFLALPVRADFPFREPSGLEEIRALSKGGSTSSQSVDASRAAKLGEGELSDKMLGAWLGRCAGCALGKPVEWMMGSEGGLQSWERQKRYLTAISPEEWPLRDYFPSHSPAETEDSVGRLICAPSQRENIRYMESDDDIRYTVLGQIVLMGKSANFTTEDVAQIWIDRLPYRFVCTAETQAYRNLVELSGFHLRRDGIAPERDWSWVATNMNPYREWIGAQIRVDSYGYAAPGNPALAAEFAWRDSRLSHVKNGIYGAMFCAAMIAESFVTSDPLEIIHAGLAQIPHTSRLHAEMLQTIEICARHRNKAGNFEAVIGEIYTLLGHYHPVHTNNNAAVCVAALLLSGGDFHKGITLAVMGGLDSDCNGATVGSIVGAITGGSQVPAHWSARLNDTLNSEIVGYHPIAITECARRSAEIARKILAYPR